MATLSRSGRTFAECFDGIAPDLGVAKLHRLRSADVLKQKAQQNQAFFIAPEELPLVHFDPASLGNHAVPGECFVSRPGAPIKANVPVSCVHAAMLGRLPVLAQQGTTGEV